MGTSLLSKLSRGGAFFMGILGFIAPNFAAKAMRARVDQIDQETEKAMRAELAALRHAPPADDVEAWNSDMRNVSRDIAKSFDAERERLNG